MKRLLLDTHVFLWWRAQPRRVKRDAALAITSAEIVFVSAATAWECALKVALGKLSLPGTVQSGVEASGFSQLAVSFPHAELVATLPRHHTDPFDRLLIAQASQEQLTIVTHDRAFEKYGIDVIWT